MKSTDSEISTPPDGSPHSLNLSLYLPSPGIFSLRPYPDRGGLWTISFHSLASFKSRRIPFTVVLRRKSNNREAKVISRGELPIIEDGKAKLGLVVLGKCKKFSGPD
ncbi:hypothetical protein NPIL_166791, partial [Nephila pilipes]